MEVDREEEETTVVSLPDFDRALEIVDKDPKTAEGLLNQVIQTNDPDQKFARIKELSIYKLGELYVKYQQGDKLRNLLVSIRPFFASIPKARTAKIVRTLIDLVGDIPHSAALQTQLCKESIDWCNQERRTFLRQRIESRLASLLLMQKEFKAALQIIGDLIKEVKKIDDKLLLVEIQLVESRIHLALKNLPKAKASLTAARAASNSIYCPPGLQAEIDEQAGTLCTEERDYKTGFSYFYEAFESFSTVNNPKNAVRMLKYMLLTKIMTNTPGEVFSIISSKAGVKHSGIELDAMKAVAEAYKKRSLQLLDEVLRKHEKQLLEDPIIKNQLNNLYENLLEQNLLKIIEPFTRVEIAHVAELINLPIQRVQTKLSEMILDRKFNGILDQGAGDLIIYDAVPADATYESALATIKELSNVVDRLYSKARRLGK